MQQNKTIKFFISSTFKDFEGERNILQKFVFPKLKDLCHEKGFGFQPIDLRWGVKEEAGYDQQTMNICLNEIHRSSSEPKPNLLLLVGQRYGWVPIPYDIDENEFNTIIKSKKLNNDEIELIKEWYLKDENYIDTKHILKDKYKYKDDRDAWSEIESRLRSSFQKVFNNPNDLEHYKKYNASATEQEMYEGLDAFNQEVDHSHTYSYFREIVQDNTNDKDLTDYIDKDLLKLNDLKDRLQNKCNIPKSNQINGDNKYKVSWDQIVDAKAISYENLTLENAPEYLKKFHDDILEKFETSIKSEIDNFEENTKLQIELEQQKLFLGKKSEVVLGRDKEAKNIIKFLDNVEQQYYLQYGRSGTGKTSVMSKAISEIDTNKYEIIYRFIGTTASSTYSRQLFENIYWEIESKIQNNEKLPSPIFEYEDDKFKKQFRAKLTEYQESIEKPIIIFLDAVDQLEDKNDLRILLDELPQNIKVVFSCLYDETKKENDDYVWYFNRLESVENKYKLKSPTSKVKSTQDIFIDILDKWLENENREITQEQKKYIKSIINENTTPLYLRLVYEIVKHWKHDEKILDLKKDEKGLIYQFFDFIVKNYHHEEILLKEVMGYITASKDGLSEEELIDIISRDDNFLKTFQNHRYQILDRLPNAIWSRFYYYIQDIFTEKLIDGEMLISPYHRIIEEAIEEEYHNEIYHVKLADYFYTLQDKTKTWDKRYNNLHMLSEYPYQLLKVEDSDKLKDILFDLEFSGSIYDNYKQDGFRNIMSKAPQLDNISDEEVYPWKSFYLSNEHYINKKINAWKPHNTIFQLAYENGIGSTIHRSAIDCLSNKKINWLWFKPNLITEKSGAIYSLNEMSIDAGMILNFKSSFYHFSDENTHVYNYGDNLIKNTPIKINLDIEVDDVYNFKDKFIIALDRNNIYIINEKFQVINSHVISNEKREKYKKSIYLRKVSSYYYNFNSSKKCIGDKVISINWQGDIEISSKISPSIIKRFESGYITEYDDKKTYIINEIYVGKPYLKIWGVVYEHEYFIIHTSSKLYLYDYDLNNYGSIDVPLKGDIDVIKSIGANNFTIYCGNGRNNMFLLKINFQKKEFNYIEKDFINKVYELLFKRNKYISINLLYKLVQGLKTSIDSNELIFTFDYFDENISLEVASNVILKYKGQEYVLSESDIINVEIVSDKFIKYSEKERNIYIYTKQIKALLNFKNSVDLGDFNEDVFNEAYFEKEISGIEAKILKEEKKTYGKEYIDYLIGFIKYKLENYPLDNYSLSVNDVDDFKIVEIKDNGIIDIQEKDNEVDFSLYLPYLVKNYTHGISKYTTNSITYQDKFNNIETEYNLVFGSKGFSINSEINFKLKI